MWRTIAKLLWAFRFYEIDALNEEAYVGGLTREPAPFKLGIEPRGEDRVSTIRRELADAQKLLRLYE